MEKQAKREKKLAERRAKKQAKAEEKGLISKNQDTKMHDISKTITLEDLTNPNKK